MALFEIPQITSEKKVTDEEKRKKIQEYTKQNKERLTELANSAGNLISFLLEKFIVQPYANTQEKKKHEEEIKKVADKTGIDKNTLLNAAKDANNNSTDIYDFMSKFQENINKNTTPEQQTKFNANLYYLPGGEPQLFTPIPEDKPLEIPKGPQSLYTPPLAEETPLTMAGFADFAKSKGYTDPNNVPQEIVNDFLKSQAPKVSGPTVEDVKKNTENFANYQKAFNDEISKVEKGDYGAESGIRESVINKLSTEFPGVDTNQIKDDVYGKLTDGFEQLIQNPKPQVFSQTRSPQTQPKAEEVSKDYVRYQGSDDVFDKETGKYITYESSKRIPNFDQRIEDLDQVRPDVKNEADFASKAEKDIQQGIDYKPIIDAVTGKVTSPEDTSKYTSRDKLQLVWQQIPSLQEFYDYKGDGKPGTVAEGTSIEDWAMYAGYKSYPELLSEYSPESVVKIAYKSILGRDPDTEGYNFWVQQVKDGKIGTFKQLSDFFMQSPEYNSFTEEKKLAIQTDFVRQKEDVPTFEDYFNEEKVQTEVEESVNDYYDKEWDRFLKESGTNEQRLTEDYETLMGDLTEDEEKDLTQTQIKFRQALNDANNAYDAKGLAFSSIREQGIQAMKDANTAYFDPVTGELKFKSIDDAYDRKIRDLEQKYERGQEDIEFQKEKAKLENERSKQKEIATLIATRKETASNIFGQILPELTTPTGESIVTGSAAFTPGQAIGGITPPTAPPETTLPDYEEYFQQQQAQGKTAEQISQEYAQLSQQEQTKQAQGEQKTPVQEIDYNQYVKKLRPGADFYDIFKRQDTSKALTPDEFKQQGLNEKLIKEATPEEQKTLFNQ